MNIEICENYKYLGVILNEFLDFVETANILSEAAGRPFLSLVTNLYNKTDLMYSSYTKIYESKIVPIMDYCSCVMGPNVTPNQILFIIEYVAFLVFINVLQMQ